MKKTILILNTGGTISSIKTARGYEPSVGSVQATLEKVSTLQHPCLPNFIIKEYFPLLDSSNMTVDDWNRIATDINDEYHNFDGFLILHGTDTMAYTASALSFMLENLAKPVVLTGSQIPLAEVRNDAMDNIITSLLLCASAQLFEVCVYFNQRLLRGNRTQKVSTSQLHAFDSPNFPHLATIGIAIEMQQQWLLPMPKKIFKLQAIGSANIANLRLFPGLANNVLEYILLQPLQGLILETYGSGNAPNKDKKFLRLLNDACERGIVIINCSQCPQGRVEMNQYATGHGLKQAGLISGHDMTLEAAHCKLLYLLNKDININKVKHLMETNICGELSNRGKA